VPESAGAAPMTAARRERAKPAKSKCRWTWLRRNERTDPPSGWGRALRYEADSLTRRD